MKKVRYCLAAIALVLTLSGPVILGMGTGSLANAASSQHVSTASVAGKSTRYVAYRPLGWCPILGMAC